MRAPIPLSGARLCILMAELFLFSFPVSGWGQLNVVSVFPSDGATNSVQVLNLHLMAGTRCVFGITGALSTTKDPLKKPVAFTFTTGDVLPAGTLSGTISSPSADPTGTGVILFKTLFDNEPNPLTVVSSIEGTYTLNYALGDTYLVAAAKDIDRDGEIHPDRGVDIIAAYDPDRAGIPDPIVTSVGGGVCVVV